MEDRTFSSSCTSRDDRNRLQREFGTLRFLGERLGTSVPQTIYADIDRNYGVLSFEEGVTKEAGWCLAITVAATRPGRHGTTIGGHRNPESKEHNVKVQIYSLKVPEDAAMCGAAGVDFIGVATGERGRLAPEVSFATCREIFAALPTASGVMKNALTVAWDVEEIVETVRAVKPDVVHLSGDIERMPPDKVGELRRAISPVKILQAIPVGTLSEAARAISWALAYQYVSDYYILDTKVSTIVGIGATGTVHDWSVSAEIVRRVHIPVILAGGLSAENVAESIRIVKPWGVDSFTHTNLVGTKRKDPERVQAFVAAARSAL